ncbi:MAG: hypothetical protein KDE47_13555, partial [Caldilineaceae bacterium]|nr:hypothetical protein [Caldilineaceae bacterium]
YLHTWRDPETGAAQPVIHRDIKPANIKRMPDGRYMLLDFGIAKATAGEATAVSARALTPGYAPIEQYEGGTDARSDIYSLGATLYALLSGKAPPSATGLAVGKPLPPLHGINGNTSPRLAAVIQRAMALRPEARYQSAAEMHTALFDENLPTGSAGTTAAILGAEVRRTTLPPTTWQQLRSNPRYSVAALLVSLGLVLIAGSSFWLLRPDGSPAADTKIAAPATEREDATPIAAEPPTVTAIDGQPVAALAPDTPTASATPSASPTTTATSSATPDLAATEAADEARIIAILATRDALATRHAPTPTPTATSTAVLPTATPIPPPLPSNTPIPPPPPTSIPSHCTTEPQGPFVALWRKYQTQLGCPLEPWPGSGLWAEQPYQNGHMFWSENARLYLVTVGDN